MPPKKRTSAAQAGRAAKKPKQGSSSSQEQHASSSASPTSAVWCKKCSRASTAACRSAHECVDVQTARQEAEGRVRELQAALSAVQATLCALQELESRQGVQLTAVAKLRGDEGEQEEGRIGISLSVATLSEAERAAVLRLFQKMDAYADGPFMENGCDADLAGLRARLPARGVGTTLQPGALLVPSEAPAERSYYCFEPEDVGEDEDGDEKEAADPKWTRDGVRIYYNNPVKPHQACGSKVLGYITSNVKLLHKAKPQGPYHLSGWGMRVDTGMAMELEDVKFV